jgi:hypothetical protein
MVANCPESRKFLNSETRDEVIELSEDVQKTEGKTEEILINLKLFKCNSYKMGSRKFNEHLNHRKSEIFRKDKFFEELFEYSEENYRIKQESFNNLFDIFDDNSKTEYHEIALEAFYLHFSELKDTKFHSEDLEYLIGRAMETKNIEYGIEILKLLFVFSKHLDKKAYQNLKNTFILSYSTCKHYSISKTSYNETIKACDREFFNLLFILSENFVVQFKTEYKKFIKTYKECFGEYWNYAIERNGQLLYLTADLNGLVDSREFLLINTKESGLKLSIMTSFRRTWEFQALFGKQFEGEESQLMVS